MEPTADDLIDNAFGKLSNLLSVQRVGYTYLISIEARSESPDTAARIANAVTKVYIEEQLASKVNVVLSANTAIQSRIADANNTVAASEDAFDTYITDNLDRIAAATGRTDLIALRAKIDATLKAGVTLTSQVQAFDESFARRDWDAVASALKDDAIAKLASDRRRLQVSAGTDSAQVSSLREQLANIDKELEARANAKINSLRSEISAKQSGASDLRRQLRTRCARFRFARSDFGKHLCHAAIGRNRASPISGASVAIQGP